MNFSKQIFDLIDSLCQWDIKQFETIDENTFIAFRDQYVLLANNREILLKRYLNNNPKYFRSYLPITSYSFSAAKELVWYHDEMVIADPLLYTFNKYEHLKLQKTISIDALKVLKEFKSSIESGYILLTKAGTANLNLNTNAIEIGNDIVNDPFIENNFLENVTIAEKPSLLGGGLDLGLLQLFAKYDSLHESISPMGMYIPEDVLNSGKLTEGVTYDFITPAKRISIERLQELGKSDLLNQIKELFKKDSAFILDSVENSKAVNTPLLLLRDVDFSVAKYVNGKELMRDELDIYKYILPYLENTSSERLHEIRQEIPAAFREFRALMFTLHQEIKSKGYNSAEAIVHIEKTLIPLQRKIEVEMRNAVRKSRYKWVDKFLSILSGNFTASGTLTQPLSDLANEKQSATLNSAYFLWKAQQNK
jgi:hypothetical protein